MWGLLELDGTCHFSCVSLSIHSCLMACQGCAGSETYLELQWRAGEAVTLGGTGSGLETGDLCTSRTHLSTQRYVLVGRKSLGGGPAWPCSCHLSCPCVTSYETGVVIFPKFAKLKWKNVCENTVYIANHLTHGSISLMTMAENISWLSPFSLISPREISQKCC